MTRRNALKVLFAGLVLTLAVSCGGDGGNKLEVPEGCNPLAANYHCLLPFPSDFFLDDDPSLPSGRRLVISPNAIPQTDGGDAVDFTQVHPADGFSILPQILAYFPFAVDDSNLVFHTDDLTASQGPTSPTVLLDAETGERILHFAELDPRATDDTRRALVIRPLHRLQHETRYIVAIRDLNDVDGLPLPPGEGFARLRDADALGVPALDPLVDHYEQNIFPQLDQAGVAREGLQLAWDFTTESEEHVTRDMLEVRRLTMAALEATPPRVTIDDVLENYDSEIFRRVRGSIEVPLFLESTDRGAMLNRDASGNVVQNGTMEAEFTLLIPHSVNDASPFAPARIVQYGHGFFGQRREIEGGFVRGFANETGMVVMAVDWWGMAERDVPTLVTDIMTNMDQTLRFTDGIHQGMANQIALGYAARTSFATEPDMEIGGQLAWDPDQLYWYGISQGHILGSTFVALSPHIERAVMSVGGCAFPFMMFRSSNFLQFLVLIEIVLPDFLDQQIFVTLSQTSFDRIDPVTYAPHLIQDLYPGGPAQRSVLMQIGIGDPQVANLASHVHARAIGLSHLQPAPRPIIDLPEVTGPTDLSALVEFDFNLAGELPGTYAIPPDEPNEVHEGVRRTAAGKAQIDAFLRPGGRIENFCSGACDPE